MFLIAFILLAVDVLLIINVPDPGAKWIKNAIAIIAVILAILATTGIPGVHIGR